MIRQSKFTLYFLCLTLESAYIEMIFRNQDLGHKSCHLETWWLGSLPYNSLPLKQTSYCSPIHALCAINIRFISLCLVLHKSPLLLLCLKSSGTWLLQGDQGENALQSYTRQSCDWSWLYHTILLWDLGLIIRLLKPQFPPLKNRDQSTRV